VNGEDDLDPHLIELGLGKRDGDLNAIYTVSSSIWVSDDGLLYVGSEALRKSLDALVSGAPRRRLDSIKQQLTLVAYQQDLAARRLEAELNPTAVPLSYEDAICLFLAYLTDLAVTELGASGKSRYVKRRFTIPCWPPAQRKLSAKIACRRTALCSRLGGGRALEALECFADNAFDQRDFIIAQCLEFVVATILGQRTVILTDEHD
jgi:hypothetical protein